MKTAVVQPFIYHVNGMNEKFSTISVSYDLKVQMASLSVIVFLLLSLSRHYDKDSIHAPGSSHVMCVQNNSSLLRCCIFKRSQCADPTHSGRNKNWRKLLFQWCDWFFVHIYPLHRTLSFPIFAARDLGFPAAGGAGAQ